MAFERLHRTTQDLLILLLALQTNEHTEKPVQNNENVVLSPSQRSVSDLYAPSLARTPIPVHLKSLPSRWSWRLRRRDQHPSSSLAPGREDGLAIHSIHPLNPFLLGLVWAWRFALFSSGALLENVVVKVHRYHFLFYSNGYVCFLPHCSSLKHIHALGSLRVLKFICHFCKSAWIFCCEGMDKIPC
jgi:hypothetical protein